MLSGSKVVCSDAELDKIEAYVHPAIDHMRSLPNPERVGILDAYIVWIDIPHKEPPIPTVDEIKSYVADEL